ncbi:neuraminidase-like domain-containing protein [Streptomyces sp. URMC 128]|uniref:neuraminidase-like domain-containing protein n=1 Tax=Streptomyces sp. URMC 128 TaxID=3423404 RepID=UPI003F1987CC
MYEPQVWKLGARSSEPAEHDHPPAITTNEVGDMEHSGRVLEPGHEGNDVGRLHEGLGVIGFEIPRDEIEASRFGPGTRRAVQQFQENHSLEATGVVDERTAASISRAARSASDGGEESSQTYHVTGLVVSPERGGVVGLDVQIIDRNVGEDITLAETTTDWRGHYAVRLSADAVGAVRMRRKERPDLQVRILAGRKVLASSEVRYGASPQERLDVLLPEGVTGLPSELQTLTSALSALLEGDLSDLQEDDAHQDVTYLAKKSGWDARAVAFASLSRRFARQAAERGHEALQSGHYYALLRAGVAADPDALYGLAPQTARTVWQQAIERGVVPASLGDSLDEAVESFQHLSADHSLGVSSVPGASALRDLLALSLGDDADRLGRVAALLVAFRNNPAAFWDDVREEFGCQLAERLRLDGELAMLTLNNAPLIGRLHDACHQQPLSSPADLVRQGYHKPETWRPLIQESVPQQIPGDDVPTRARNYADMMAARVRLSFPTAVIADLVGRGELQLTDDAVVQASVHQFLTEHADTFRIGMQPVDRFVECVGVPVEPPVRDHIRRLQRVYQITPDDRAMKVLLDHGLDSAYSIVHHGTEALVARLGEQLGGEEVARMIAAKAKQVQLAVLSVASAYLTTRAAPALGADPDARVIDPVQQLDALTDAGPQPRNSPTLEDLFGSMDYCACEHCRSVLSPAAYLVDLLLFAERPQAERENPQKVLLERRPDLQHLPLTCENTNTPLPYIDIVNETLEHFVVNGMSLNGYTGHDTSSDVRPEDLLASPQFVQDKAYERLQVEWFPPPLPFHRPLEILRRHFAALDLPLATAMESLRADEALERVKSAGYAWRDILIERISLSRDEHKLLTDGTIPLADLYGFPAVTTETAALTTLADVKAFTRRVDIDYDDLIAVLETHFINRDAHLLPQLRRLGVPFTTLAKVKAGTLPDSELAAELPAGVTVGDVKAFVAAHYDRASRLILITEVAETAPCSLDGFRLRYADPDPAKNALKPIDYVRLARFVRLWRKLGWTIEHTDAAINALYPSGLLPDGTDTAADLGKLDAGFLTLLPRLGVALAAMERLDVTPGKDLPSLLACWAPIQVHGRDSLYGRLFLGGAFRAHNPAFAPDKNGVVLQDPNQKIGHHAEALRAATTLTAEELSLVQGTFENGADAPLTLENVSALYRHSWLARKLRVSVGELLALIRHTGLNPFAAPDPPRPPMVALLDLLDALRRSKLAPGQALHLVFNANLIGTSAPEGEQTAAFARTLRAGFADIDTQFAIVDDPSGDLARARMALIYGAEAADLLFALLNGTFSVKVGYTHPTSVLEPAIVSAGVRRLSYDPVGKQLSFAGAMTAEIRQALQGLPANVVNQEFREAVAELEEDSQKRTSQFFGRYPELLKLYTDYVSSLAPEPQRLKAVLATFLPRLVHQRKRQHAFATLSGVLGIDAKLAEAIADDAAVLHAKSDTTQPALDDLTAVEAQGLSAQLFWNSTATGTPHAESKPPPMVDYGPEPPATPLPSGPQAGAPVSGVWRGFIEAPETGEFTFAIDTDAKNVILTLDEAPVALDRDGERWCARKPLALSAGRMLALKLTAEKMTTRLTLRWRSVDRGWQIVPGRHLYRDTAVGRLKITYARILKAASLATATKLTPSELTHLATDPDLRVNGKGWLNALPTSGQADEQTDLGLFTALRALLDFAALKTELAPQDERLLVALKDPTATDTDGTSPLLAVTGWQSESLDKLLQRFRKKRADLTHIDIFARVHKAYAVLTGLGTSAAAAIAATTNNPSPKVVAAFQAAVRARYDEADWLAILRPINDELRSLQRDALVAYVLRRLSENETTAGIDTPDKLFEYFLMDVCMQPCMQTSRIRHALSSVQLFLERCLMNLEPRVAPSSIDAVQWEWMKRYRVWEANRKVFLWPENWLEPELRDDQSPFFKEVMSELLQGDITEERAAAAVLNYLIKLEEVAQLEPCAIYVDEHDVGAADDIVHMVARTAGARRKYFYRRREFGQWTPWEHITLDIEDNPVLPFVWKGRLFLFWLRVIEKSPLDPDTLPTSSNDTISLATLTVGKLKDVVVSNAVKSTVVDVEAVLCYSEYINGKWQPVKTSDPDRPTILAHASPGGFQRQWLHMAAEVETTGDLFVRIGTRGELWAGFRLKNTHSAPVRGEDLDEADVYPAGPPFLTRELTDYAGNLGAAYQKGPIVNGYYGVRFSNKFLKPQSVAPMTAVTPGQPLNDAWATPFLLFDSAHAFYVDVAPKPLLADRFDFFGVNAGYGLTAPDIPPIHSSVSEDAFMKNVLGNSDTVRFGPSVIGPAGTLPPRTSPAARGAAAL